MDLNRNLMCKFEGFFWLDDVDRRMCSKCVKKVPETIPDMKPEVLCTKFNDLNHILMQHPADFTCRGCYQPFGEFSVTFAENKMMDLKTFIQIEEYVKQNISYFRSIESDTLNCLTNNIDNE